MRKSERNSHLRGHGATSEPHNLASSSTSPLPPSSVFSTTNPLSSSTSLSSLLQASSLKQQKQQKQQQELLFKKLKTIDQKISTLSKKSTSLPHNGQQNQQDASFLIDTKSIQITSCPNCYQTLQVSDLRKHLAQDCHENIIQCSELGCGISLPKNEMKNHLQFGCKVAKARRLMAKNSIQRKEEMKELLKEQILNPIPKGQPRDSDSPQQQQRQQPHLTGQEDSSHHTHLPLPPPEEEIEEYCSCPDCHERILLSILSKHQQSHCIYRKIFCVNRHLGCSMEVPLVSLDHHLIHECEVEKRKEQLIQNSRKRLELVQCPGCGEKFPLGKLTKHELEECPNRKVPCRNAVLGCPVMVRLKDRKSHEDVHSSIRPRSCLYFDGCDTQIVFNEPDISPPWTIEFWIYRPSLVETTRCYLRDVLRLGNLFRAKLLKESRYREELMAMKNKLQDITTQAQGGAGGRGRSHNMFLNPEFTEMTLKLANMIQEYERLALETTLYGQLYFVAIRCGRTEIDKGKALRNHKELLDLTPEVDGIPCKRSYQESSLTAPTAAGGAGRRGDEGSRGGKRSEADKEEKSNQEETPVEEGEGEGEEERRGDEEEGQEKATEEGETEGTEEEEEKFPEGFDELTTRMIDFDWNPKLWKEWGSQLKALEDRYEYDQELVTRWRIQSGLINDRDRDRDKAGAGGGGGTEGRGESKRLKQERRQQREKRYKMNKSAGLQGESKFSEMAKNLISLYQGASLLCHSPNRTNLFLHLSSSQIPSELLSNGGSTSASGGSTSGGGYDEIEGSIGYCDWLHGLVSFKYQVPRERWTHIAIMATVEPKKRVQFFSDGVLMNTIKDKTFDLPMAAIGSSSALSFHGYLLDIRYWGKVRSVPEIKLDMRCLIHLQPHSHSHSHSDQTSSGHTSSAAVPSSASALTSVSTTNKTHGKGKRDKDKEEQSKVDPSLPDLTGKNLIGWWPLEDGGYSRRVRDVSDHRFPSLLRGGKIYLLNRQTLWFEAMSLLPLTTREAIAAAATSASTSTSTLRTPQISLPLPSYLEKNLCPFEIKRSKLAQRGRALLQLTSCPNASLGCPSVALRKIDLRHHLKFECPQRIISCRYEWCGQSFPASEERLHYTSGRDDNTAAAQHKHCCRMIQNRNHFLEKFKDSTQKIQCSLCSKEIPLREFGRHEQEVCRFRIVPCEFQDCSGKFPIHMKRYHEIFECGSQQAQYRKWLVQRARERSAYPRPWGIAMTYSEPMDTQQHQQTETEEIGEVEGKAAAAIEEEVRGDGERRVDF